MSTFPPEMYELGVSFLSESITWCSIRFREIPEMSSISNQWLGGVSGNIIRTSSSCKPSGFGVCGREDRFFFVFVFLS